MPAVSSIEAFTRDPVVDDGGLGVDGGTDAASTGGVGVAGAGEFVVGGDLVVVDAGQGGEVVVDADSGDVIAVADDGGLGVEGVVYYLILKF